MFESSLYLHHSCLISLIYTLLTFLGLQRSVTSETFEVNPIPKFCPSGDNFISENIK